MENILEVQKKRIDELTEENVKVKTINKQLQGAMGDANDLLRKANRKMKEQVHVVEAIEMLGNLQWRGLMKVNKNFIQQKWKNIMGK